MRKSDSVFFLTGTAALVYQTVWIRLLSRLVGSDAVALAVVLAIFMGGMGLGAWLFAGPARWSRRPERLFAALELGVGVWAALSPWLLPLLTPVEGFAGRALLGALFLLPPTLAMGATFPLMGRLTIRSAREAGSETSAFYGANTLGAATGALLGPLLLMPLVGLSGALWIAAGVDFLAAALALRWLRGAAAVESPSSPSAPAPLVDPILLVAAALGCCGLALEVLLVRLLVTVTGASVYAYAIVLAVFLAGIGLGSAQLVRRDERAKKRWSASASTLSRCALFLPAVTLIGLLLLRWQLGETDLFGSLQNRMPSGAGIVRLWASHALFAALALLPPAILLGAALPSAAAALLEAHPGSSRESVLGRVYAFNTAGALTGSLLAAFCLIPVTGPRVGLALVLGLALLAGVVVRGRRGKEILLAAGLALLLGAMHFVGGPAPRSGRLLYVGRDSLATVSVEEVAATGDGVVRALRVNGKVVATTAPVDLRLQRFLGQVPALLHGDVKRAVVIGMGTGMTAGALLDFPTLEALTVIEISPSVPVAASHFARWNGNLLADPRTRVLVADGRHALALSDERWDLITSDPIHPWTRGSSDLYSLEHFQAMAEHLAPGGVASQWLPLYQLSEKDVKTVIATWCAAFPHTSAWLTAYDLALVGSAAPLPGEADLAALALPAAVAARLAETAVHAGAELVALRVADDAELRAYPGGTAPMRDDRPVLEFRAPLSYLGGYSVQALRWAGREAFVETLPEGSRERAREVRSILRRFLDELPEGKSAAAERYGEALFALPPLSRAR